LVTALPLVSVIVPVLDGAPTLKQCLLSLLRTDYPPERREIVVVDNGSTDPSREIAAAFPVILVDEGRRGAAAARNRGVEASHGEILAFTDADCVVSAGWLRELVQTFEADTVAAVEGQIVAYPPTTSAERYAARTGSHSRTRRSAGALPGYVVTANVAFRREVFRRIGLFDTRFPGAGGEDVDFSWRFAQERDFELRYAPKAVVFHRHRATAWGLFTQRLSYGYGRALLHGKYPDQSPWGWRQEWEGYRALAWTAWRLIRTVFLSGLTARERGKIDDLSLSLVAGLGHRIGFARGLLLRGGRR